MFMLLLRLRIKAIFSSVLNRNNKKKKRSVGMTILFGLLMLYAVCAFLMLLGLMFSSIRDPFVSQGLGWLYFALAAIMAFILCFIGSVFATQSQIYESGDNELLMSMPIPPSAILASRMAALLLCNYLYCAIVMIPAIVVYCMGASLSVMGFISVIFIFLLIPVLSQTLSCIIGWLIALIGSKMRSKNTLTMLLSIGFLAAYFVCISKLNSYVSYLASNGASLAVSVRRVFFPMYQAGLAAADGKPLSLLIFAACCVIPFLIVYRILSANYISISTSKSGASKKKYRARSLKVSGSGGAFLKLELNRFTANPMYMMNSGMGAVLALLLSVAAIFKGADILGAFAEPDLGISLAGIFAVALSFCISMNCVSAASISLDGKTLWLLKSLPTPPETILTAKAGAHFIVSAVPLIPSVIICAVISHASPLQAAAILVFPISVITLTAFWGVVINLRFPKFDWISEMQAIKQSASIMIALFSSMGIVLIPTILMFIVSSVLSSEVFLLICSGVFFLLAFILYSVLKKWGVRTFAAF